MQTVLLGDVTFRMDYNSAAMISDGSILAASEITSYAETAEEAAYTEWRLENLTNSVDALIADLDPDWSWRDGSFFDVELKDPDGNVRQPESQMYLTVYYTIPIYTEKVRFVRFIADEYTDTEIPEVMEPVDLGYTEDGGIYAGVFLVDSLAPFGVISGDSLQVISEQEAEQETEDAEVWEDEPETEEEEIILADETVEGDGFEAESDAESMEEAVQAESEAESVAEPVLTESDTESVAEPVLTESTTESVAEPVLEEVVEYPARVFRGATENVNVTVLAPEGAFPADAMMTVEDVSSGVINDITEAVSDDSTTVNKVHAVDITFTNGKGNEVEPLAPVKMTIAAEEKQETEETLVVHVSDEGNVEQIEDVIISDGRGVSRARLTMEAGESGEAVQTESAAQTDSTAEELHESVLEGLEGTEDHEVVADAFSVYAIVYTVDFHWEVNGKEYEFSIPGDGFVSLEHLVEVLGIAGSGETKKFVADVASVEFSSPELVWVGKVDETITIGRLKEANQLEITYSVELTEEQIKEINSSTVEGGDWALISVQPFTSEESLTVTMKNGDRFVVRVTDAGETPGDPLGIDGESYAIVNFRNKIQNNEVVYANLCLTHSDQLLLDISNQL